MGRRKFPAKFVYGLGEYANASKDTQAQHLKIKAAETMLESLYGRQKSDKYPEGFYFKKAVCTMDGKPLKMNGGLESETYPTANSITNFFKYNPGKELLIFDPSDNQPHYLSMKSVGNGQSVFEISEEPAVAHSRENRDFDANMKECAERLQSVKNTKVFKDVTKSANSSIKAEYEMIKERANSMYEDYLSKDGTEALDVSRDLGDDVPDFNPSKDYTTLGKNCAPGTERISNKNYESFINSAEAFSYDGPVFVSKVRPEDRGRLADQLVDDMLREPSKLSYDDFTKKFNVPDNEKLSMEQISERDAISELAIRQNIKAYADVEDSASFIAPIDFNDPEKKIPSEYSLPPSNRQFKTMMCRPGVDNKIDNIGLCKLFGKLSDKTATTADKVAMSKEIEKRYKELLATEKMFDKKYSDKELAQNWPKLREVCMSAGMEYKVFAHELAEKGITVDPKLQKQMDAFHEKVDTFNSYYTNRMDYMCSSYYRYGAEKEMAKPENLAFMGDKTLDEGVKKTFQSAFMVDGNQKTAIGLDIIKQTGKSRDNIATVLYKTEARNPKTRQMEIVERRVDMSNGPSAATEIAEQLQKGNEVMVITKDSLTPQRIIVHDAKDFPPQITQLVTNNADKNHAVMTKLDMQAEQIQKGNESPAMKDLEEDILMQQYKLGAIANNMNAKGNEKEFRNTMAQLMARISIKDKLEKNNASPELIEKMTSKEAIKAVAKDLKDSGVVDQLLKDMPKNSLEILNMDNKAMTKKFDEAKAKVKEAPAPEKTMDAPQQSKQAGGPEI